MKTALILFCLVAFSAISFGEGLAFERPPIIITKTVTVTEKIPVFIGTTQANVDRALKQMKAQDKQIDLLSAAIPASALREVKK